MRAINKSLLLTSAAVALVMADPAHAQSISQPTPPEHYSLDPRGVDLVTGNFNFQTTEVAIGQPGQGGLALTRGRMQLGWRDSNQGTLTISGSTYTVAFGLGAEVFTLSGGVFTPKSNSGATLSQSGATFTFTTSSGVVARYTTNYCYTSTGAACTSRAVLYEVVEPNGETTNYHYVTENYVRSTNPVVVTGTVVRLQSVTNNRGYQLHYTYKSNSMSGGGTLNTRVGNWLAVASVTGVNNAVDYCAPTAASCTYSRTWPSVAYTSTLGGPVTAATDQSGRVTQYLFGSTTFDLTGIRYPGSTSNDVTVNESGVAGQVSSLTDATGAWNYSFTDAGVTRTAVSTGPDSQSLTVVTDLTVGRPSSITNALGQTVSYLYDTQGRLTRTTNPEGDYVEQTLDARGNVTQVTATPKSGSGLSPVSTSASYPSSCSNPVTCNLPTDTTDALGNVTDYTWDSTHGGPLTITAPAPTSGADRPQTRYTYAAQTAYYKNSGGSIVAAPTSVTLPTQVSACATGTSCTGAANEVLTTVAYGSTGVANNLLPTSTSRGSGANPSMAVTAMTWTPNGDVETVDGPLSGTDDTTRYRYDNARRPVGVVGPDPDGAGAGLNRAQRVTYDSRGLATKMETGTTAGQSDGAWAAFSPLVAAETDYDAYRRPVTTRQQTGAGATVGVQQVSYDASGRPDCTVVRMNTATFSSLPGACTAATAGSDGPDRISQTTYDTADRPLTTTSALGLSEAVTESVTYTANGQAASLTDGNGNVSTVVYDGFDRMAELQYPGHSLSTPDRDVYGYDAGSNVTAFTNRGGQAFTLTYDALNRLTTQDAPSGTDDVTMTYDNLGRATSIAYPGGQTIVPAWDALSRKTSETTALGTVSSQYDAAGRRTRLTWPDALFVSYEYDLSGGLTAVKNNAGVNIQTFTYNDLGARTGTSRANGVSSTWGYDAAGRLTSLSHDPAGSGEDVTFGYSYNPAGQIVSRTVSNPVYVHAPVTGSTSYTNNGKNQVTVAGGVSVNYDGSGNITSLDGVSRSYNARNQLTASGSATFQFDPAGRLHRAVGAQDTRFLYDGQQVIGEVNASGTLIDHAIPGLGATETLATNAAGSGVWLLDDERGSVIGRTTSGGTASVNAYDEYGMPDSANTGRFQYTGQMWLPDAGLYHYRARAYAPQIGRFMQTDPIGYEAGANLYAYVGGDPVNAIDPFGLQEADGGDATDLGTIWVRGRRVKPQRGTAQNRPNYNERRQRERSDGHDYQWLTPICTSASELTADEREDILRRAAYPGQNPGRPVGDNSTNLVTTRFGDIPGGFVTTQVSPDGQSAVNTTTRLHGFQGRTVRSFVVRDGALYIHTRGSGTSTRFGSPFDQWVDDFNQLSGPVIFATNDVAIQMYVAATYPECIGMGQ